MGVHGLETYMRENYRSLADTIQLPVDGTVIPVVVDGFSFIYHLFGESPHIPWVYGGEHREFSKLVSVVTMAMISVGLKLCFVFDGPMPALKFPTIMSRLKESRVQGSLLFFRTSSTSRMKARFLNEICIKPTFYLSACVTALEKVARETNRVEIHYADGEGDPFAVALAARIGAYVMGRDSDFVVLNAEGYLGYIPIHGMVWAATHDVLDEKKDDEGNGFQQVRKSKSKGKAMHSHQMGRGMIPPEGQANEDLTLTLSIYSPSRLAAHFDLPAALLPLLGSLVGNDFSAHQSGSHRFGSLFFERSLSPSQRITRVGTVLHSIITASTQKRPKQPITDVMDLVDRAVNTLLIRPPSSLGSGEVQAMIEGVVEAAVQYALPKYEGQTPGYASLWSTAICALHDTETCPVMPYFSRALLAGETDNNAELEQRNDLRLRYIAAYRSGRLPARLLDILCTGTYWSSPFLESPDLETVSRSIGRPIRECVYAFLDHGVGLPGVLQETHAEEPGDGIGGDDDEELIDVVENTDSDEDDDAEDLLAPLRGQLKELRSGSGSTSLDAAMPPNPAYPHSTRPLQPLIVIEYVRKGTRIAPEEVVVPSVTNLRLDLPLSDSVNFPIVQLMPEDIRMNVFLKLLRSDAPAVRAVPSERLMAVVTLRWIVRILHERAEQAGNNQQREKERWTNKEGQSFLRSFSWSLAEDNERPQQLAPLILDRNVQLTAQVLEAFNSIALLHQTLLLPTDIFDTVQCFSGVKFHHHLCQMADSNDNAEISDEIWRACTDGLSDCFRPERRKHKRTTRPQATESNQMTGPHASREKSSKQKAVARSLFSMLSDAEI